MKILFREKLLYAFYCKNHVILSIFVGYITLKINKSYT